MSWKASLACAAKLGELAASSRTLNPIPINFPTFFKRKAFWIPAALVVALVGFVYYQRLQGQKPQYSTEAVARRSLKQTVSVTGTVEAAQDVQLNFKAPGRLVAIDAKVGDTVRVGQRIAALDSRESQAAVLTADAALKGAVASYEKLKSGGKTEDINVVRAAVAAAETTLRNAQQSLENTKASQSQAVANGVAQLLGLPTSALPAKNNISTATATVSGTYVGTERGTYTIRIEDGSSPLYSAFNLETVINAIGSRTTPTPVGTRGLKVQFSATGMIAAGDSWTIEIPNTASASYAAYQAAYEAALTTQKQQVDAAGATVRAAEQAYAQAEVQLAQVEAPARSYDLQSAEAQVESARANLLRAQAELSDRTILAPVAGTITKVNNQVGETTSLATPVAVLLAEGNREIKVQVPESDIAKLKVGQVADVALDAFGAAEHFIGHVSFIDPASTVIQDVVYYEVTVLFDSADPRLKPGMTANLDIVSDERQNVLVVPLRAVRYDESRQAYVEVLGADGATLTRKNVTLGLRGDDGLAEVIQGLSAGDTVVTYTQTNK